MVTFPRRLRPGLVHGRHGRAAGHASHRRATGRLTLRIMPADREEVPMLGRIKLIHDAIAAGRPLDLAAVMQIDNREQLGNEAYAWCWAAAKFLDSHPRYRDRFRALRKYVRRRPISTTSSAASIAADWADLTAEWQAYIATLDYGYDFERMAIDFRRGEPLAAGRPQSLTIRADRGWQSSGVWLAAGKHTKSPPPAATKLPKNAQPTAKPQPWPCEPGGVTIEYHDGQPLGMLLGAIDARDPQSPDDNLAHPVAIGLGTTLTPTASGTLYLRVNDSASRLDRQSRHAHRDDRVEITEVLPSRSPRLSCVEVARYIPSRRASGLQSRRLTPSPATQTMARRIQQPVTSIRQQASTTLHDQLHRRKTIPKSGPPSPAKSSGRPTAWK